jgi:hypothetical protein
MVYLLGAIMQPTQPRKMGRPLAYPTEGGASKNFTVRLTPAQQQRALQYGATVSQGINNLLREVSPEVPK